VSGTQSGIIQRMSESTFLVMRARGPGREPPRGRFIVMPWPGSDPLSSPPFGLVPPEQTFRGTEEETRRYLADRGQSSSQIQRLVELANDSPEFNAPECVVVYAPPKG
jgi:hypothetical protein